MRGLGMPLSVPDWARRAACNPPHEIKSPQQHFLICLDLGEHCR